MTVVVPRDWDLSDGLSVTVSGSALEAGLVTVERVKAHPFAQTVPPWERSLWEQPVVGAASVKLRPTLHAGRALVVSIQGAWGQASAGVCGDLALGLKTPSGEVCTANFQLTLISERMLSPSGTREASVSEFERSREFSEPKAWRSAKAELTQLVKRWGQGRELRVVWEAVSKHKKTRIHGKSQHKIDGTWLHTVGTKRILAAICRGRWAAVHGAICAVNGDWAQVRLEERLSSEGEPLVYLECVSE